MVLTDDCGGHDRGCDCWCSCTFRGEIVPVMTMFRTVPEVHEVDLIQNTCPMDKARKTTFSFSHLPGHFLSVCKSFEMFMGTPTYGTSILVPPKQQK